MAAGSGYGDLTAWIDPIDGTKEFSRGRGDQCTICVGFANVELEHAFAGIVYRPISSAFARAVATRGAAAAALPSAASVSEVDSNFAMGCEYLGFIEEGEGVFARSRRDGWHAAPDKRQRQQTHTKRM